MGGCVSTEQEEGVVITEQDKALHKEAEKQLKEAKQRLNNQVKVLLLGSGDSGKSTILKQMRLIHTLPFTPTEIESYRQLIFGNLTHGLKYVTDGMEDLELKVNEENIPHLQLLESAPDIRDHEPYPTEYREALRALWRDPGVRAAFKRGNEYAVPENLTYFMGELDRLFKPDFSPNEQDIVQTRARTTGITETSFQLTSNEMVMVDVGGQKSERRKWIHCFQDVTSILFLVSLSGFDQCMVEDKDANQMQDAMTIWDSICHSQWFKNTSIILFLNKNDLFEEKLSRSDIKTFFPDFEGAPQDPKAGRDYFRRRFGRLAQKAGRSKEREIYIHITTATDTAMLRVVMAAVEDMVLRGNLVSAALI